MAVEPSITRWPLSSSLPLGWAWSRFSAQARTNNALDSNEQRLPPAPAVLSSAELAACKEAPLCPAADGARDVDGDGVGQDRCGRRSSRGDHFERGAPYPSDRDRRPELGFFGPPATLSSISLGFTVYPLLFANLYACCMAPEKVL